MIAARTVAIWIQRVRLVWFVISLSSAAFGTCGPSAAQQWQEHRPAGAGYRVEFPGTPEITSQNLQAGVAVVTAVVATVKRPTGAFMAIHNAMPLQTTLLDPQTVLDGARDGGVRNVNGQLREERRISVDGAPARRVVIDIPRIKGVALILVVLRGDTMYQALHIGPAGTEESADVERFTRSFSLVDR